MAKVLIIDDDADALAVTASNLRKCGGFDAVTCQSSLDALSELTREQPDVVLLDIMMPRVDGFQICRQIKETPGLEGVKIIVYSAKIFDVDRRKALRLGADAYLSKVVESDKLIDTIHRVLDAREVKA